MLISTDVKENTQAYQLRGAPARNLSQPKSASLTWLCNPNPAEFLQLYTQSSQPQPCAGSVAGKETRISMRFIISITCGFVARRLRPATNQMLMWSVGLYIFLLSVCVCLSVCLVICHGLYVWNKVNVYMYVCMYVCILTCCTSAANCQYLSVCSTASYDYSAQKLK